jgi:Undecaprenyl-phosphate glucose phosphotransferase
LATGYSKYTRVIYLIGDIILVNLSFCSAFYLKYHSLDISLQDGYSFLAVYYNLAWIGTAFFLNIYDTSRVEQLYDTILRSFKLLFFHVSLVTVFIVAYNGFFYSREHLMLTYLFISFLIILWRAICLNFFRIYRKAGGNYRRVVIVGYSDIAKDLKCFFNGNPHYGYQFLGFFDDTMENVPDKKGKIEDLKTFALDNQVDEIYCTMPDIDNKQINEIIDFAEISSIHVKVVPDFREINYRKISIDYYDFFPVLTFREIPLDDLLNKVAKRAFDIIFSLVVLVFIASWLFPMLAFLIRLDSSGPILFKQKRSGKDNKDFWCFKFRSMYVNDESDFKQATRNDSRITRIGRILRKTNLDEMPQFINVLLGHMSVVGPRPHPIKLNENYQTTIDRYMDRHLVKPGVTGLAQVKGYRGETAHPQLMKNRVRVDLFYIENWSFILDLKIIFMTVASMLKGDRNAF